MHLKPDYEGAECFLMQASYPVCRIILCTHRSGSVLSVLYVKGDKLKDKTLGNTSWRICGEHYGMQVKKHIYRLHCTCQRDIVLIFSGAEN